MTLLSDREVRRRLEEGGLAIEPFEEGCLSPAGYEARLGSTIKLKPGEHCLAYTLEVFKLPLDLAGFIYLRSSLAREGLIGSFAVIDPGFRGQLTLPMFNAGRNVVEVEGGERVVQVVFYKLSSPASRGYAGSYQGSEGAVASRRKRGFSASCR